MSIAWRKDASSIVVLGCAAAAATVFALIANAPGSQPLVLGGAAIVGIILGLLFAASLRFAGGSPIVFPFAVYAALLPIDNSLSAGGDSTLTRALGIACGAAFVVGIFARRQIARPSAPLIAWTIAVAWMTLSVLWTSDGAFGRQLVSQIAQLFALYAIVTLYPAQRRDITVLRFAVILGGFATAAYAILLYSSDSHLVDGRVWFGGGAAKVDPNHFAAALQLPLALAFQSALANRSKILRLLGGATGLVIVVGIFLSGSRGGALAMGALVIYLGIRNRSYVVAALLGLGGLAASFAIPTVWDRILDPTQGGGAGRTSIWSVAWLGFKDQWLVGTGIGSFPTTYDRYMLEVYERPFADWHRVSHNMLLGSAVEFGIIGLILVVAVWVVQATTLRRIAPSNTCYSARIALEGALLALAIESMFVDVFNLKYFWLTFTFAAIVCSVARHEDETSVGSEREARRLPPEVLRSARSAIQRSS